MTSAETSQVLWSRREHDGRHRRRGCERVARRARQRCELDGTDGVLGEAASRRSGRERHGESRSEHDAEQASFSAASGGAITTDAPTAWTNVPNAETYAYVSFWDASVAGNFLGSDNLTVARTVAVGDNFTIATGDLDIDITAIAA